MVHMQRVVLIANEDDDSCTIYSQYLESCGYRVLMASGAEQTHRLAAEHQPDVIVTEFVERTQTGWRTPETLKHDVRTADIPLVGVTGWAMPDDQRRALRSGCDMILVKPVSPLDLALILEGIVAE